MRRLVPDYILTRYAAGQTRGAVVAAVLSVDVVGFSEMTDVLSAHGHHGAEVVASLMREVFEPLIDETHGHGGFVVGFAGDSLTAVFPADESDDPPIRAGAAALAMLERTPETVDTEYGAFTIEVRIGGAISEVAWGIIEEGDPVRSAYYVRGSAVDESADLQQSGEPGCVLVTAALAAAIGRAGRFGEDGRRLEGLDVRPTHIVVPATPAAAFDVLVRFLPGDVLDHPELGEFRQVVSVFVRLGEDPTVDQVEAVVVSALRLQRRHGGLLSRVDFGDKGAVLVLFWGAPIAHENDVVRAVEFAMDLRQESAVSINAGVAFGTTHAGFIGSEERDEYTCYGPSTNLAARLMAGGAAGEIRISGPVAERVATTFAVVPLGSRRLKGFRDAIPVFTVAERASGNDPSPDIPLIGRSREIDLLESFTSGGREAGFRGVAMLVGDAGLGKTRIIEELRTRLEPTTATIVARCDETVRDPFTPLVRWLRERFDVPSLDGSGSDRFDASLDDLIRSTPDAGLAAELDRTRSVIGSLVGLSWPGSLFENLSADGRWENTVIAVGAVLRAESLGRPVVLVLEDVHWLDESTRRLLPDVIRHLRLGSASLAILATSRSSDPDPLGDAVVDLHVDLEELTVDAVTDLAAASLGGELAPDVAALVVSRADGNPFFAQELVRFLRTAGAIHRSRGAWRFVEGKTPPTVPSDVRAVIAAQLDAVDREVRDVILSASVLGIEFDVELLSSVMGRPGVRRGIAEAVTAGFLLERPGGRLQFRHALVRDAAYEMQALARRRTAHERAVAVIEELARDKPNLPYAELAFHAERAGLTWQAAAYHADAGRAAASRYANEEAVRHFSRVLVLLPETSWAERWEALMGIEEALHILGWRDDQREVLARLDELAGAIGGASGADLALRKAEFAAELGEYHDAVRHANDASDEARRIDDRKRLAASLISLARYEWRTSHDPSVANRLHEAIDIAEDEQDAGLEADARVALGIVSSEQDQRDDAVTQFRIGLERAREAGDRRIEAWALNSLGVVQLGRGDLVAARTAFDEALQVRRAIGHRVGETGVVVNLAMLDEMEGRYVDAVTENQRAVILSEEIGDRYNLGWSLNNLGLLWGMLGRTNDAERVGLDAVRVSVEIGEPMIEANALSNLSLVAHQRGDDRLALERATAARTMAESVQAADLVAETLTNEGHALAALGDLDRAEGKYRRAVEIRGELGDGAATAESMAGLARIALERGQVDEALHAIEPVIAQITTASLDGAYQPFRVYLTSVEVLEAVGDDRSGPILSQALEELMVRADRIEDAEIRTSFLMTVPSHRRLYERAS